MVDLVLVFWSSIGLGFALNCFLSYSYSSYHSIAFLYLSVLSKEVVRVKSLSLSVYIVSRFYEESPFIVVFLELKKESIVLERILSFYFVGLESFLNNLACFELLVMLKLDSSSLEIGF